MTPTFLFDCGSPNAYLAHRLLPGIAARTRCPFTYVPVLIGGIFKATGNQSPMQAFAHVPAKLAYQQVETDRFVSRHGLADYRWNPHFPVNTLLAMRVAAAAQIDGATDACADVLLRAMWERGEDLADPAVLEASLTTAGLDGPRLLARAADPEVKARLADNTAAAVAAGVFGIPSFLVGDQLFFGKNSLDDLEHALAEH
jgi:2-hydroxychromene-2-carboxylate isomerase